MKLLVSAFEPFNGSGVNSSLQVLNELSSRNWHGKVTFCPPLPVLFNEGWKCLEKAISEDVDIVVALGQGSGLKVRLERVALNLIDAGIPDNSGYFPKLDKIIEGAPDFLWSPLPWDQFELSSSITRSYSAGAYVCNELMYRALHALTGNDKQAGFIHVPTFQDQEHFQSATAEVDRALKFLLSRGR